MDIDALIVEYLADTRNAVVHVVKGTRGTYVIPYRDAEEATRVLAKRPDDLRENTTVFARGT